MPELSNGINPLRKTGVYTGVVGARGENRILRDGVPINPRSDIKAYANHLGWGSGQDESVQGAIAIMADMGMTENDVYWSFLRFNSDIWQHIAPANQAWTMSAAELAETIAAWQSMVEDELMQATDEAESGDRWDGLG